MAERQNGHRSKFCPFPVTQKEIHGYQRISYKAAVIVLVIMGVIMVIASRAIARKSLQESKSELMIVRIPEAIIAAGSVVTFLMLIRVVGF